MPVEGQWERLNNPLPERDKRVLMIGTFVVVLGATIALVFFIVRPSSSSHAGCVKFTVPSTMGGAVQYHCGADAKTFCRAKATVPSVDAQCRRLGYFH